MGSHSVTCHPTEWPSDQPKQVLVLATPEGCKVELTYVTVKMETRHPIEVPFGSDLPAICNHCGKLKAGRELNPGPVNSMSNALPLSHHATLSYLYVNPE